MNRPTKTAYDITHDLVRINGVDLHHVVEGDAKAPSLVLINMASHNLTCWEVVLGRCSNTSTYCVLTFAARANPAGVMRRSLTLRNTPMTLRG